MPRVTALNADDRPDLISVELDGSPWRALPVAAVAGARLSVGVELDRGRARELGREVRRAEALSVATRVLAGRDRSKASLDAQLERRGVRARVRNEVLGALEQAGYLNDAGFGDKRAATLAERGYGNAAIQFDLEQQGLAPEQIEESLATLPDESERALAIVETEGGTPKTLRRLVAKGFTEDALSAAADSVFSIDD